MSIIGGGRQFLHYIVLYISSLVKRNQKINWDKSPASWRLATLKEMHFYDSEAWLPISNFVKELVKAHQSQRGLLCSSPTFCIVNVESVCHYETWKCARRLHPAGGNSFFLCNPSKASSRCLGTLHKLNAWELLSSIRFSILCLMFCPLRTSSRHILH